MSLTDVPEKKTYAAAYFLWVIGGPLGLHRLYLQRVRSGVFMLLLCVAGVVALGGMTLAIVSPGLDIATALDGLRSKADPLRAVISAMTKTGMPPTAQYWFFAAAGSFGFAFLWAVLDVLFIPSMVRSFRD